MKHWTLALSALCLPSVAMSAEKMPALVVRAAIAFDMSPPLEQFIPDKPVVIHPAVESPPQPQGEIKGPGAGLGATPPAPCGATGVLSGSGPFTCTYDTVGSDTFTVPAGVTEGTISVVGAMGGHYFIAMKVPPPDPGYGAFVLATSAHSDSILDWDGSGDALIGIHGPIDPYDDSLIGTTGARISHGCIRLHDVELSQLAAVLPGSPLDIVS